MLDGISDWRERFRNDGPQDSRFGAAFQGWFSGALNHEPFNANVRDVDLPFKQISAWLISSGANIGILAQLENRDGANILGINEMLSSTLQRWNGHVPILSMLNGNEHATFMFNRYPAYDFIDQDLPGVETGVPLIDTTFIDEVIAGWIRAVFVSLLAIRHVSANPLFHTLPPPPREHPERSLHPEGLGGLVAQYGFLPARLRLKWYLRYCRQLRMQLESIGCHVLAAPVQACTEAGLLRDECAEGLTHGNANYGRLVAQQFATLLESQ